MKKENVLPIGNDYSIMKNAATLIFGEGVKSLIIKKNKVVGVILEKFKILSKKLDDILRKILDTPYDNFSKVLSEIRTKKIYGFETIELAP